MEQVKTIDVEIVNVDGRLISVESQELSGDFEAAEHVLMQYVRPGKARIKVDAKGNIVYAHNLKVEGQGNKPSYSGFKKTYAPANTFKPSYQQQPIRKNKLKVFTHITGLEYQKIYNELSEKNKIIAATPIKSEFTFEDENKLRQYYYDVFIYYEE
jgi:hypothetical protein